MPARKKKGERNVKISGTIEPEQYKWVQEKIKKKTYYNISHVLQKSIDLLRELEGKKEG